jgi:hypothetical protein
MDIEEQERKAKAFLALAERFRAAADPHEVEHLGDEVGRFVFGDCPGMGYCDAEA